MGRTGREQGTPSSLFYRDLAIVPTPRTTRGDGIGGGSGGSVSHREQSMPPPPFGPDDTNCVIREFEKCGPILNQVYGPGNANWIHIQYQNKYDAQKALVKNGAQLSSTLIVGVKLIDKSQRMAIMARQSQGVDGCRGSLTLPVGRGTRGSSSAAVAAAHSSRPYLVGRGEFGVSTGIAQPTKSTVSKLIDYVFGM
ncbi:hypothetical protein CBR_g44943 [Chara braunii]|uniref:RRM Nup35-type domain-containing protein n=1 Tax=Chara braunii TaxID=69332 RepID=A0A388LY20_CHABU|nr:hypothetical protein CBR_g44943 [Chara braunii]|eukprot:GBG87206.1 hypothetical protein CBR_g44943 [Chara braunii]